MGNEGKQATGKLDDRIDITGVRIDIDLPPEERARRWSSAVGDPYRFRVGSVAVDIEFAGGGSLEERLGHYLAHFA